ncbi:hypothetical protein WJX72_012488 [[Myrmecia] bisecta]|uniref:Sialate O-acetylesterase domain-containing protein n=1 Tax=[Myrmecia] bisecta TaxID=41462 RepID=A0AAW1PA69_9CHLO
MEVFILSGQSNMAGRGGVYTGPNGTKMWDGVVPEQCRVPPGAVLRLNADGSWKEATAPLHHDIDLQKVCGIGPGLPFAARLLERGGPRHIGLVPCAVGATAIDEWDTTGRLYQQMISRTKRALQTPGTRLQALLWYQGESDADTAEHAATYATKFTKLMRAVRHDLDHKDLPIFQVAITCADSVEITPYRDEVRRAQLGTELPHCYVVDAQGLELQADGLHLTPKAQVILGGRLADAYLLHSMHSSGGKYDF